MNAPLHTQPSPRTALVIGATGSFGAHAVQALLKHGWRVRALARDPKAAAARMGAATAIEWRRGDALDPRSVAEAAKGVQVIVHAANPPGYHDWKGLVLPMMEATIAAARASGARIVLPGNVYNYGPDMGPSIGEDALQRPATRKGKIRVAMENRLRAAADEGVRTLVLRAGDFFGPAAHNSALSWLTVRSRTRVKAVRAPGPRSVGHAFAYLPDLTETMARLLEQEARLGAFEVFHFKGHWLADGHDLGHAIRRVTGQPRLPITPFPWMLLTVLSPVVEMFRELLEMRYLWERPIGLDNGKLVALIGAEPHTPLDIAVHAALADLGVADDLPAPARGAALAAA